MTNILCHETQHVNDSSGNVYRIVRKAKIMYYFKKTKSVIRLLCGLSYVPLPPPPLPKYPWNGVPTCQRPYKPCAVENVSSRTFPISVTWPACPFIWTHRNFCIEKSGEARSWKPNQAGRPGSYEEALSIGWQGILDNHGLCIWSIIVRFLVFKKSCYVLF